MISYFMAKIYKWRLQKIVYASIVSIIGEKNGRLQTILNLIDSLKDMTGEDLKIEFISGLAGIIHDEAEHNRQENIG